MDKSKLAKYANVFNRLKFDTNERKKFDDGVKKDLSKKNQDPF